MNVYIIILVIALGTFLTRVLPFVLFRNHTLSDRTMKIIDNLPYATISLLVVYSFKDTQVGNLIPTVTATLVCVFSYMWKNNTIVSIVSSTLTYMVLLAII